MAWKFAAYSLMPKLMASQQERRLIWRPHAYFSQCRGDGAGDGDVSITQDSLMDLKGNSQSDVQGYICRAMILPG